MITHRHYSHTQTLWMAVLDVCCMIVGIVLGVVIRIGVAELGGYIFGHLDGWLFLCGGMVLTNYLMGNYGIQVLYSRFNLFVTGLFSLVVAVLVLGVTSYAWFDLLLGRGVLALSAVFYTFMWFGLRLIVYGVLYRSRFFLCQVSVLGTGACARETRRIVENAAVTPLHRVVSFIHLEDIDSMGQIHANRMIDGRVVIDCVVDGLVRLVQSLGVRALVIGFDDQDEASKIYPQLRHLRFDGIEILGALGAAEMYGAHVPLHLVNEAWIMQACMDSALPVFRRLKRTFDLFFSALAMILLAPVFLLIALVIKFSAPHSPVLYSQVRIGQFGEPFTIYKFRTMIENAERCVGPVWSERDDSRVTRFGRFLRKFRLDEFPQFVNVIRGEMSLVGPRPERPELIEKLEKHVPFYRERLNMMPGLSGWAQVRYPYANSIEDAKRKLELDLYYMKHLSLQFDIQILLSTIRIVLFGIEHGKGAGGKSETFSSQQPNAQWGVGDRRAERGTGEQDRFCLSGPGEICVYEYGMEAGQDALPTYSYTYSYMPIS